MIIRAIVIIFLTAVLGCANFSPKPIEEVPFKSRAQTQSRDGMTVSASVLSDDESEELFGVNLAGKDIQPVWLSIKNDNEIPCLFLPITLDPHYFSPNEAAFMNHYTLTLGGSANKEMDKHFNEVGMHVEYVSAGEEESGFVFSNMDPGIKYVEVTLYCFTTIEKFVFYFEVPGFQGDYDIVDWQELYSENKFIDYDNEEKFRKALENLPCCTTDEEGEGKGYPINLVFIGDTDDIASAFIRRGWDVSEPISDDWEKKIDLSKIFSTARYRTTPMSREYFFGRSQDYSLQKTRQKDKGKIRQRIELRVWLTPIKYKGEYVWFGSTTRDIGSDFTRRTEWYVAKSIDPEVDEARSYLTEDIGLSNNLSKFGYVGGSVASSRSNPVRNFKNQSWWSDGMRAVLLIESEPTSLSEIEILKWDLPGDIDENMEF
ncbi:MAG TPA: LssY C-terminal domain-containing protein [Thermodesulfobacteriota bacterium]